MEINSWNLFRLKCYLLKEKILRPLKAIFRRDKRSEYEKVYELLSSRFPSGTLVKVKAFPKNNVKFIASPEFLERTNAITRGEEDEHGFKEIRTNIPVAVATVSHSFFHARDTWCVVRPELTKEEFVEHAIWSGSVNTNNIDVDKNSFCVYIEPLDPSKIAWPHNDGYGKNVMRMDIRILEKASA